MKARGSLLHKYVMQKPFTIFFGSDTQIVDTMMIYQSYTIGTAKKFESNSSTLVLSSYTGGIYPSIRNSHSCMKDNSGSVTEIDIFDKSGAFMKFE